MGAGLNGIERRKAGAEEVAGCPIRCVIFAARGGADGSNDFRSGRSSSEGETGERCERQEGVVSCFHE